MAKSSRPRLKDLRAIYLLTGECCELGADPVAWRTHVVEQVPTLFHGQLGLLMEVELAAEPFESLFWVRPRMLADFGWATESDRKPFEAHIQSGKPEEGPHITPDLLDRRAQVFHWRGDLGTAAWHETFFYNEYVKKCHLDDGLFAHSQVGDGQFRWLFVNSGCDGRPFSRRERTMMKLLNGELARLQTDSRLSELGAPSVAKLSPRLRDVLTCLMEGASEKETAAHLGISVYTVHDHVKALYKRFDVASRGELLAICRTLWPALEKLKASDH
ncbi:MAG: helix-turn-helix transcriptional regulator [Planctomycetaceae bacterium]|nr:helix-turn-helix transcriptional regulator [Planctomycetaceae bacterium]